MKPANSSKPNGIRPLHGGWQAYVRVDGIFRSKLFPKATAPIVMRRWREEQKVRARLGAEVPTGQSLLDDIADYLTMVQTMPTIRHRRDDLSKWLAVFGSARIRKTITAGEIRAQLEVWKEQGYAANTVNHRRTALMHLWTVLDGRSAPNPAKDVPRYTPEAGPPRALSPAAVALILAHGQPTSQNRARAALMAWTGWPQAQIAKIQPTDIDWHRAVFVRPRRKGKGAAGVWLPLLPAGWLALQCFKELGCWGGFSTAAMRTSMRRWAVKAVTRVQLPAEVRAELDDVTPYQLRHSFATLIAVVTQDDRAVQALLQHSDIRTSHIYTGASVDPRVAAAIEKVVTKLQTSAPERQVLDSKG